MAKRGQRNLILLVCDDCKDQNYISEKNKINTTEKLQVKKFCAKCNKRTPHNEKTRLK